MDINNKYYLVYDGNDFIMAGFATGELSSNETIEVFDTAQEIVDRAYELGFAFDLYIENLLQFLEDGANLNQDYLDYLYNSSEVLNNPYYLQRMNDALGSQLTQRNFTTLKDGFGMYYSIPTHTSSADFTHTVYFVFSGFSAQMTVLSGGVNAVNESFLRLDPTDGSVDLLVNGGAFLAGSASAFTPDNKRHELSLTRVGNDYTIRLDGLIIQVFNQTAAEFLVDNIGVRADSMSQRFSGVLSNVNLASGERDYLIDERWIGSSNVLVDYGTDVLNGTSINVDEDDSELFTKDGDDFLGVELITNGGFDDDADWVKGSGWTISEGIANYDGTGGTSSLQQIGLNVIPNYSYKTSLNVVANTGSTANPIDIGALRYNFNHLDVGFQSFIETQTMGTDYIIFGRASEPIDIDNVSTKRILQGTP